MKPISRTPTKRRTTDQGMIYRYLKPGALAQLRDLKISAARSHKAPCNSLLMIHRVNPSLTQIPNQPQISVFDEVPCVLIRKDSHGPPHCLKRKKLIAVKSSSVFESSTNTSSFLINGLNNDVLVAH